MSSEGEDYSFDKYIEDAAEPTQEEVREAMVVLTGRAVDLIPDETERFYAVMSLSSMLGLKM